MSEQTKLRNLIYLDDTLYYSRPELTKIILTSEFRKHMGLDSEDAWAIHPAIEGESLTTYLSSVLWVPHLPPVLHSPSLALHSLSISLEATFEVGIGKCVLLWSHRPFQVFCYCKLGRPRVTVGLDYSQAFGDQTSDFYLSVIPSKTWSFSGPFSSSPFCVQ